MSLYADKYESKNVNGGTNRSTNFHTFRSGKKPPGKIIRGRVRKNFPRSDYCLDQPIWEIFRGSTSLERTDELLRQSRPDILSKLYKVEGFSGNLVRRKYRTWDLVDWLIVDGTFDALNVLVLLMVEDEHNKPNYDVVERKQFMSIAALELIRNICSDSLFLNHYTFLFQCIQARFYYYWDLPKFYNSEIFKPRIKPPTYNIDGIWFLHRIANSLILQLEDHSNIFIFDRKKRNRTVLALDRLSKKRTYAVDELLNVDQTGINWKHTPYIAGIVLDTLGLNVDVINKELTIFKSKSSRTYSE